MSDPVNTPMTSEVSICNQALGWLGQNRITSLNDDSFRAQLCKENYPFLRDAVIEERMWNFATVRAVSETADRDEFDTRYVHSRPGQWLKVMRAYQPISRKELVPDPSYRLEGSKILSIESKLFLMGVVRVTDTSKFSQMFVQCLATRLAADLCLPITEDGQKAAYYTTLYQERLVDAAATDGQQGANDVITQNRMVNARYGRKFS